MMNKIQNQLRDWQAKGLNAAFKDADVSTTTDLFAYIRHQITKEKIDRPTDKEGNPWWIDDECIVSGKKGKITGFDGREQINVYVYEDYEFNWFDCSEVERCIHPTQQVINEINELVEENAAVPDFMIDTMKRWAKILDENKEE